MEGHNTSRSVTDLGSVGDDLKRSVVSARQLIEALFEVGLRGSGVSAGEAEVLTFVLHNPEAAPTDLASKLGLTTAGITGRLNSLDRKGLIERRPNPNDGRGITIHLLRRGREVAQDVTEFKVSTLSDVTLAALGPDHTFELIDLITRFNKALGQAVASSINN